MAAFMLRVVAGVAVLAVIAAAFAVIGERRLEACVDRAVERAAKAPAQATRHGGPLPESVQQALRAGQPAASQTTAPLDE
jgi:hypothetical protein